MKKLISILLVALCVLQPSFSAMAESTKLQTVIPSEHSITINCGVNGKVMVNGVSYTGTVSLKVPRHSDLVITAVPNSGFGIAQLGAANMDGVTISGQTLTLKSVYRDNIVSATFYQLLPYNPGTGTAFPGVKTGDEAAPALYMCLMLMSIAALAWTGSRLRKKQNT